MIMSPGEMVRSAPTKATMCPEANAARVYVHDKTGVEKHMRVNFEFPSPVLSCLLPYFAKDLSTLLAVCCVSRQWKEAATSEPNLWKNICVPEGLKLKITDEKLALVLDNLEGQGLVSIEISRCHLLTDHSVHNIVSTLKDIPEVVNISECGGFTWRSVIPLAQHMLKLLGTKKAGTASGGRISLCLRATSSPLCPTLLCFLCGLKASQLVVKRTLLSNI